MRARKCSLVERNLPSSKVTIDSSPVSSMPSRAASSSYSSAVPNVCVAYQRSPRREEGPSSKLRTRPGFAAKQADDSSSGAAGRRGGSRYTTPASCSASQLQTMRSTALHCLDLFESGHGLAPQGHLTTEALIAEARSSIGASVPYGRGLGLSRCKRCRAPAGLRRQASA